MVARVEAGLLSQGANTNSFCPCPLIMVCWGMHDSECVVHTNTNSLRFYVVAAKCQWIIATCHQQCALRKAVTWIRAPNPSINHFVHVHVEDGWLEYCSNKSSLIVRAGAIGAAKAASLFDRINGDFLKPRYACYLCNIPRTLHLAILS